MKYGIGREANSASDELAERMRVRFARQQWSGDYLMMPQMTAQSVVWFQHLFDELGIQVWLDGGWGVDALIGEQTRPHGDLDIMIPTRDAAVLVDALRLRGFEDVHTDDRVAINFVMSHVERGLIDFHIFELQGDGSGVYDPGVRDWVISAEELDAKGEVQGHVVRCLSVGYQVRSHAGYELGETDFADMAALSARFGVDLLPEQVCR